MKITGETLWYHRLLGVIDFHRRRFRQISEVVQCKGQEAQMQIIDAGEILAAIERGELEAIGDDGVIVVTANGVPFLKITEAPTPQISQGLDHAVTILSGDVPVARIDSKTADDAARIASILRDLLVVV